MSPRTYLLMFAALMLSPITARAQFSGAALFEPEIGIVNSGAVLDAQATVSADRKYVTMTMRASVSQLLALRTFQFQGFGNMPGGTVGGVNPVVAGGAVDVMPPRPNAPMRVGAGNGGAILLKRGITPLVIEN
jgi:hypothetical protein